MGNSNSHHSTNANSASTLQLQGKRILVTGADGFIGSHLVERLLSPELGCKSVRAMVLYNSSLSWGRDQVTGWLGSVLLRDQVGETQIRQLNM